jgi:hypothetical protein
MAKQAFKKGDIVSLKGSVEYEHGGTLKIVLVDHQPAYANVGDVTMVAPNFDIGDDVITDTGEPYTVAAIYRDFAWVYSDKEGFDTVELATLKRPEPADEADEPAGDTDDYSQTGIAADAKGSE